MTEPTDVTASPVICPWCSSPVKATDVTCPSCGAALHEDADVEIPGLTQVDPKAAAQVVRDESGGSIMGWLSGEYEADPTPAELASVEPPSEAVQREMLKIEVDALRVEVEAREAQREIEAREAAGEAETPTPAPDELDPDQPDVPAAS